MKRMSEQMLNYGEIEMNDTNNEPKYFEKREAKKLDLYCQYAIAAAQQAVDDSGILGHIDETEETNFVDIPFLVGESVKVTDGPFSGFTGEIDEIMTDKHKLKVIVTVFGRKTPLELGFNQVDKE